MKLLMGRSSGVVLAAAFACAACLADDAASVRKMPVLDGSKFLICTCRFPGQLQTEQGVKDLVDCGIDFVISSRLDLKNLDVFLKQGVGVEVVPPSKYYWWGGRKGVTGKMSQLYPVEKMSEWLDNVPDHPAIVALYVADEPSSLDFLQCSMLVKYVQGRFPGRAAIVELYPHYASAATNTRSEAESQLGTATYEEYIRRYCQDYALDYISFDSYCWGWKNTPSVLMEDLRVVSAACRGTGRWMCAILQANRFSERGKVGVELTANMYRFQAFSALAFGARMIDWACWSDGFWKADHIVNPDGTRSVQFDRLKAVNGELHRLGGALESYTHTATDFVDFDAKSPDGMMGVRQLPVASSQSGLFAEVKAQDSSPLLVGHYVSRRADGSAAMLVVACDDPHDKGGREHTVGFRAVDGDISVVASRAGGVALTKGEGGRYTLPLRSNEAALVIMGPRKP